MNTEKFISMKWFSERKPYSILHHTEYDLFYLELTRKIFTRINNFLKKYYVPLLKYTPEETRELSYMIGGYAEDIFNDIGIFNTMRQHFKLKFSSPLPIVKNLSPDYNENDIQPEDILFLLWYFHITCVSKGEDKPMLNPSSAGLIKLSKDIFDELDAVVEFPTTDLHNDYFHITDEEEYIPVKNKILWFALKNYLTGFELTRKHEQDMQEYMGNKKIKDKKDIELLSIYNYSTQDIRIFETPLSLGALTSSQLFAKTVRCSENMRTQIANLVVRHYGIFHLQSEDNRYYHFYHTGVKKNYKVIKKSFNNVLPSREQDMWVFNLVAWKGEYELTGTCIPCVYKPDQIRIENLKMQNKFYCFDNDFFKNLNDLASEYSRSAQKFFGKQLISYSDEQELKKDMNNFMRWHQTEMKKKYGGKEEPEEKESTPPEFTIDFESDGDLALFIPENDNTEFILGNNFLENLITTPVEKWSQRDREEAAEMITAESVSAEYVKYLYKKHPDGHWDRALYLPKIDKHALDFLLHFYKPHDFKFRKSPRFTSVDTSVMTEQDNIKMQKGLWTP
ncbi:MAG: DUF3843 family protein [Bacteroidetes bacterium]|nr:DUF3843 family protein [Bacteroidota bacterium]